jgi:hypothetical protein
MRPRGYRFAICTKTKQAPAASLTIPILYRDMLYSGTTVPRMGHPNFQSQGSRRA